MATFKLLAEHATKESFAGIRKFCKQKGITVRLSMDKVFINTVVVVVDCEDKRGATAVRNFIWNEVNYGAFCEIERM